MRLQPAKFNAFLDGGAVSQTFIWRRSFACPCVSDGSGSPADDCPLCNGKGRQWQSGVEAKAGMTNQTPQKAVATFGTYEFGDATMTIPSSSPLYGAGQFDRIRSLRSTNPFSSVIRPGLNDKLQGSIVSIDRVFWLNDARDATVDGAIPKVAADGSLAWTAGAPPAGRKYTISGRRWDEWFVYFPLPADRNSGVCGLPRKAFVRTFDIFGR